MQHVRCLQHAVCPLTECSQLCGLLIYQSNTAPSVSNYMRESTERNKHTITSVGNRCTYIYACEHEE